MSHYTWGEPTAHEKRAGVLLAANAEDGTRLLFGAEIIDEQVFAEFAVCRVASDTFTSRFTEDWPEVEKYIPRSEWPNVIYAGRRGPAGRHPDPEIAAAVAEVEADLEALLAVGDDE